MLATETIIGGRYRLGPVIGRGGGADVHRAEDLETGNPVAVKVLRVATPSDLRRFELEAQTLSRLDHPAIVRMCDRGEHEGVPYLVLDLIDGEPLVARLERGPLGEEEAIRIGTVLAAALAHAHSIGVVHRDVKPGNVLFDRDDRVHLTDFGIARLTDVTAITATGFVIGTAAYLAPEQVEGEAAGPASDVYALGLVLLEAITGERAYPGTPSEAALARLHRQPEIPATTNRALGPLLASMTAADPRVRPTASAVEHALTTATAPGEADAATTSVIPIVSDATTVIPVVQPETGPVPVAAAGAAVAPVAAAASPVASARGRARPRRNLLLPLLAGVIALIILAGLAFGSGDQLPANADVPTTTAPTTVPTTAPPTTVAEAPAEPAPEPPKRRGKKDDED